MTQPVRKTVRLRTLRTAGPLAAAAMLLGGCGMPNSSTPTLSLTSAEVSGSSATLGMQIENPSDMDVRVKSVDWSLVHGPLPVADGTWQLGATVPSKGAYTFSKRVRFTTPPVDRGAGEVELKGNMDLETIGASGNMALESSSFSDTARVR